MTLHAGQRVVFTYSGQDDNRLYRANGQTLLITRELEDGTEIDRDEVGPMYELAHPTGPIHAFQDELEPA